VQGTDTEKKRMAREEGETKQEYMRRMVAAGRASGKLVSNTYKSQTHPEVQEILRRQQERDIERQTKMAGLKGTQPLTSEQIHVPQFRTAGANPTARDVFESHVERKGELVPQAGASMEQAGLRGYDPIKDQLNTKINTILKKLETMPVRSAATTAAKEELKQARLDLKNRSTEVGTLGSVVPTKQPYLQPISGRPEVVQKNPKTGEEEVLKNVLKTRGGQWTPDDRQVIEKAVRSRYGKLMSGAMTNPTKAGMGSPKYHQPGAETPPVSFKEPIIASANYKRIQEEVDEAMAHVYGELQKRGINPGSKSAQERLYDTASNYAHEFFNEKSMEKGGVGKAVRTPEEKAAQDVLDSEHSTPAQKKVAEEVVRAGRVRRGAQLSVEGDAPKGEEGAEGSSLISKAPSAQAVEEGTGTESQAEEGEKEKSVYNIDAHEFAEQLEGTPLSKTPAGKKLLEHLDSLPQGTEVDKMELAEKFGLLKKQMSREEGGETPYQQQFRRNLFSQINEHRLHQVKIVPDYDAIVKEATIRGIDPKTYLGLWNQTTKKGYTSQHGDVDTATHEAFHAFMDSNHPYVQKMITEAKLTPEDLTTLSTNLHKLGYDDLAVALAFTRHDLRSYMTQEAIKNNEPIPVSMLQDNDNNFLLRNSIEELLAQATTHDQNEGGALRRSYSDSSEPIGRIMSKVLGDNFLDTFNKIYHGKGFNNKFQLKEAPGRSTWDPDTQLYSMSKEEGEMNRMDLSRLLHVEPSLDKARRTTGPIGQKIANAIQSFFPAKQQFFGRYAAEPLSKLQKLSQTDRNYVTQAMYREDVEGVSKRETLLNDNQKAAYDAIRAGLDLKQNDLIKSGRLVREIGLDGKIYSRRPELNPHYMPSIPRADVVEALVTKTGDYKKYQQMLLDHWLKEGASPKSAAQKLENFSKIGDVRFNNRERFAAMRLAEGMGLPAELRMKDGAKMLQRYFNRVATDKAWTEQVESNKEVMKGLDTANPEGVGHAFEHIIDQIKGEPYDKDDATIKGLNKVFTSALLGPLTNIHIGLSTLFNPMQYVKGTELATVYGKALSDLSSARQRAIKNGYLTHDFNSVHDIMDSGNTFNQRLNSLASVVGKVNGRDWTDTASKTMAQALGEQIVPLRLADAKAGDKYSQNLIKQLDPSWTAEKNYTAEEKSQLASTLGGFIHGAHDARTLPDWMNKESILKPFFSLMSWSVAQTNQWNKHVWLPATKGNLQPLLLSTLGAAIGGYAIQQLRQAVTDKRTSVPSIQEIADSSRGLKGNMPLLAYNFMQMASYTGFAGIGSTLAKDAFDLGYKNIPQGSTFPLDEAMTGISKTAVEGIGAWMQNPTAENFMQIMPRMMADLVKENYQTGRIAMNWAADKGVSGETEAYKYKVSQEEGNLRRFKMAEGMPYNEQIGMESNPYLNINQRQFKQTGNIGEAAQDVPGLIQQAMQRSQGNPDVLRQQLQSLKQNSYQTMPSPQSMPLQFAKYYQYLVATRGQEAAQAVMQDYMRQNAINKAKGSMIPAI